MRLPTIKSFLLLSGFLFLAASQLGAQDQAYIYGNEYLCPFDCGTWEVEFPQSEEFVYVWTFSYGGTTGIPPYQVITTEGYEAVTICDIEPSFYEINLEVTSPDGNIIAIGSYSFYVEDFSQQLFGEAYGSHTTACEQDTFSIILPNSFNDCYEVCTGSISELCVDYLVVSSANGETQQVDISDGQWTIQNGTLLPSGGTTTDDNNFSLGEVYTSSGQTVCVPLTVNNFDSLQSVAFSINYNAAAVNFVGAQNTNMSLPDLSVENFTATSIPGNLTFDWVIPNSLGGASLANGALLADLCFEVTGNISSSLNFSSTPMTIEIINSDGDELEFDGNTGAIIIGNSPNDCINIEWGEEGSGSATFSYWFVNGSGCETFGTLDFCFDVVAPPPAEFTSVPEASPNGILEVCEGQTVFFTSTDNSAESYLWDFGDGGGSSLANPQYTYDAAGSYDLQLITSAGCECADTSRMTVIVEGNETPFVDCVGTICEGTSVTYSANTGCSSYGWNISSNGTVLDGGGSNDDFITIQWGAGPIGEITLETSGCPDLSGCTTAAYLQVPIVSSTAPIEGPVQVCRGEQSVYSVPPFEGTSFNWVVSSFGTIIDGQGTPSVTIEWFDGFIPSNSQLVSVDYTNCYLECGGSAQLEVFVRPEYYVTGELEVCENSSADYGVINTQTNIGFPATFNVIAEDGSIVWSSPGAGADFTIDWNFGSGQFTVSATPQNPADFCSSGAQYQVTVIAQPAGVASITGQSEICAGIAYTYAVSNPVEDERYRWTITNGGTVTQREGETVAIVWEAAGPYALSVTRLSPPLFCASVNTDLAISPVSGFSINGIDQVCMDQLAEYTSSQNGDVYYAWSVMPASAGTIAEDPTAGTIEVLWHSAGPATVVLDICGQQETFNVTVNAPPQPVVNAPAAVCPNTTETISTTVGFATYSWQDEEGNELSTDATPSLGGGYYRLEVTDAIGCKGQTAFQIYEYPSSNISISTPDYNLFCNTVPSTRMYAVNTEDGYSYQWYQDGGAIAGETGTNYTATVFGNYHVEIIDENGCSFSSNTIGVAENCNDINSNNPALSCDNTDHDFILTENGSCDDRAYTATATGSVAGSVFWNFDDPDSGGNNFATGENVTHQYTKPGFYRVLMGAVYDDGMGGQATCRTIRPDTIYAVADFDYDGVCPGAPVQFYDLSTFLEFTNIVSWAWSFGDPASGMNTATDKDPIHIFSGDGDYLVTLTVTTSLGCTATVTETVSIFPLPATSFAEPDVSCAATALTFVADVEATVSSVNWTFGDAASGDANTSTLFTSYHEYSTVGSYNINLEATSVYGCVNNFSQSVDITPNTLTGDIDPAGLSTLCEGDQLTLTAVSGGATSWEWSTGEDTPVIEVSTAAAYLVRLTDDEGCTYTPEAAVVDIIPAPQSPVRSVEYNDFNQPTNYTYDTLMVCFGEDIYLETEQQAGYTYQWSNGDTGPSTEYTEDRNNQLPAGEHVVSLEVTDTNTGCSATEVFVIIVHPTPDIPVLASANTLCAGTTSTISVSNAQGNLVYFWSNGETGTSITTDEAGEYFVTAVNINGCRAESEVTEVLAGPDISLVPSGCHTRCAPDTLCLPTIPGVISYQWYQDGVAVPAPDGTIANLIIDESGAYTLEMEDFNGCMQTTNPLTIELQPGYGTILGNVFYDSNDNGVIDSGDDLAEDISVVLDDPSGTVNAIITDISGNYGFVDVPEEDYTVSIDTLTVPEDWKPLIQSVDTTFVGCDQEIELNWLLVPDCDVETTFVANVCEGEDFLFKGDSYAIGTTNTVTVSISQNCDSTFNFSVAALPTSEEIRAIEVCEGESYDFQGQTYGPGTNETFVMMNSVGCDSTIQLIVAAAAPIEYDLAVEASCPDASDGRLEITPTAGQGPLVYALDGVNFEPTTQFNSLLPGAYELTVEDANGCQVSESFDIEQLPSLVVFAQDEIRPCEAPSVLLQPEVISGDDGQLQFLWSDGLTTLERSTADLGDLTLQVTNGCESVTNNITVEPEFAGQGDIVYVPSAFSPNNDGNNDAFKIFPGTYAQIENIDFQVYDRWGKLVFDADGWDDEWNGLWRSRPAVQGVYVWRMEATVNLCGQVIDVVKQGDVLLVR